MLTLNIRKKHKIKQKIIVSITFLTSVIMTLSFLDKLKFYLFIYLFSHFLKD